MHGDTPENSHMELLDDPPDGASAHNPVLSLTVMINCKDLIVKKLDAVGHHKCVVINVLSFICGFTTQWLPKVVLMTKRGSEDLGVCVVF